MATTCPDCGTTNDADNVFCEVCGMNFATGEKPAPPPAPTPISGTGAGATPSPGEPGTGAPDPDQPDPPAPVERPNPTRASVAPATTAAGPAVEWVAVVEIDPAFFASNLAADHAGELTLPDVRTSRDIPMVGDDLLIGRRSESRGITPAIDLSVAPQDTGVSHRHATLSRRGDGWSVTDLGSTNGSWIAGDPDALEPFVEQALEDGQSLLLGAWTRITVLHVEDRDDDAADNEADNEADGDGTTAAAEAGDG